MSADDATLPALRRRQLGYRPRRERLRKSRGTFWPDAILFVLGAAGAYSANLVGSLPGCEILLIPMLPLLLLAHGKRAFDRQYLMFYLVVGGWLLGTILADTYNGIGLFNRMKGTARVVFFALDFIALAILINNRTRKIVVFALSLACLSFIGSWQFSGDFSLQWKFGVSQALATVALLYSSYFYERKKYRNCLFISFVLAAVNLKYGFRSQLIFHVIAVVLTLPIFDSKRGRRGIDAERQNTVRVFILLVFAAVGVYLANSAIKYAAERGIFDESTNSKFQTQSNGDYGVLVGGRPETLVALQAIRDSPFWGHGSFPFGLKYVQLQQDIQYEHGYVDSDEPEEADYPVIPTHSHLTMAWVEGGILGGICWIFILVLVIRAVIRLTALRPPLAPLFAYLLVNFLWDILYSPFGSVNRMHAAFLILVSYSLLRTPVEKAVRASPIVKRTTRGRVTGRLARGTPPLRGSSISRGGLETSGQV
jgi:O-antigen ligase